jgi:hypothetical protein
MNVIFRGSRVKRNQSRATWRCHREHGADNTQHDQKFSETTASIHLPSSRVIYWLYCLISVQTSLRAHLKTLRHNDATRLDERLSTKIRRSISTPTTSLRIALLWEPRGTIKSYKELRRVRGGAFTCGVSASPISGNYWGRRLRVCKAHIIYLATTLP